MCGFAAVIGLPGLGQDRARSWVDRACDAMAARGPDGMGQWHGDGVALGHRRLSIIELSPQGDQPMLSADGRLVIVFNGEIYNYRELRRDLEAKGCVFVSGSDTEVLLHLYRLDGEAMLGSLRGMYAFAIWDQQRQGLFLARDPFGIKPLYVAEGAGAVRVASQVKALVAAGEVDTSPDAGGWAGFYLWGHVPEPFTLYQGIRSLPTGSWAWIGQDGQRRSGHHFDLTAELASVTPAGPLPSDELAAIIKDSVRHHLLADVPVGLFLSAGLDSAALAACAGPAVQALTLGFDVLAGSAADETPLAVRLAQHLGLTHHVSQVGRDDFIQARAALLADMDQPSIDGINTWMVAKQAHALGWKVALSGVGGDELFAGYDTFHRLARWEKWMRPPGVFSWVGRGFRLVAPTWLSQVCPPKALGLLELGPRLETGYLLRRGLFMPWELPKVMDADMARAGWAAVNCKAHLVAAIAGLHGNARISALEMQFYMRNQLLRDSDWAGMAHSLEIRLPLVDVALFRALAPFLVGASAPSKVDMARACGVPEFVINRPKTGFSVPLAAWLGASGGSRVWASHVAKAFMAR